MAEITLLPHNEEGYKELNEYLKTNQLVTLNRATGTGKSFILLKYMYENRNKRILFLSPTYPIIDQLFEDHMAELGISKDEFSKLDSMIYGNFQKVNVEDIANNYDIIICDEYHRTGANKTFKNIKKLKDLIVSKYPNIKLIGTTATEIRFLDNERNMRDELFDGHEVARLTLVDALLQGILPVPTYYNYDIDLIKEIEKLSRRINKYVFYENCCKECLDAVSFIRKNLDEVIKIQNDREIILPPKGKFLAFSSTINNISDDEKMLDEFYPGDKVKYYIHSFKSNEENKKTLREFRNADNSVVRMLYSIDILKEGVHVKNVDGIFMLRKTISPIIYFQQLGRVLSYSRRKDNVLVFDLVNNINHHKEIYGLYQEVISRARELLETDPANRERYLNILDKFKIVDKTSNMNIELDKIRDALSHDNLISNRLDYAVRILEGLEANPAEAMQAKIDIFKYKDYIDIELFKRINSIEGIDKPKIFEMSIEEFEKKLDGNKNLHKLFELNSKEIIKDVDAFYDINKRLPSVFSKDIEESKLAINLYTAYDNLGSQIKDRVNSYITPDLSLLEILSYGRSVPEINEKLLIKQFELLMEKGAGLTSNIVKIMDRYLGIDKIFELSSKKDDGKDIIKPDKGNYDAILFSLDYQNVNKMISEAYRNNNIDSYIDEYYKKMMEFIDKKGRGPNYSNITTIDKNVMVETFPSNIKTNEDNFENIKKIYEEKYKNDKSIYLEFEKGTKYSAEDPEHPVFEVTVTIKKRYDERNLYINKLILRDELEKRGLLKNIDDRIEEHIFTAYNNSINNDLNSIISFIEENEGGVPSALNTSDRDISKTYYSLLPKLSEEQREELKKLQDKYVVERSKVLKDYIEFIKVNGRKPAVANCPEEESTLNAKLNRYKPLLSKEENEMLKTALSSVNNMKALRNAYYSMKAFKSNRQ